MANHPYRVVALGFFDGVHQGHAAILRRAAELAKERGFSSAAVTFETHPRALVLGVAPPMITTLEQRCALIRAQGIDLVVALPFDEKMAGTPPEEFADMLKTRWHARAVVCGGSFRFGKDAAGTPDTLKRCGLEVFVCPPVEFRGGIVSSTRIREYVIRGAVGRARQLLGRPFSMRGQVRTGFQRGRRLGYPTINLMPEEGMLLPGRGVYASLATVDGRTFAAVTNVGTRPTFSDADIVSIESYLLDFSGDLYGHEAEVAFLKYLRREREFASGDALRTQIACDIEQARALCRKELRIHE